MKKITFLSLMLFFPLLLGAQNAYLSLNYPTNDLVLFKKDKPISINGQSLSKKDYLELAQKNCSVAYDLYKKGTDMKISGIVLTFAGIPVSYTGSLLFFVGCMRAIGEYPSEEIDPKAREQNAQEVRAYIYGGIATSLVGCGMTAGGIALWVKGYKKRVLSFTTYNGYVQESKTVTTLKLQTDLNSVGLSITY